MGVLQETGGFGRNTPDEQAFVPIGVAQGLLFNALRYRGQYTVSSINVEVVGPDQVDAAQQQIAVVQSEQLKAGDQVVGSVTTQLNAQDNNRPGGFFCGGGAHPMIDEEPG